MRGNRQIFLRVIWIDRPGGCVAPAVNGASFSKKEIDKSFSGWLAFETVDRDKLVHLFHHRAHGGDIKVIFARLSVYSKITAIILYPLVIYTGRKVKLAAMQRFISQTPPSGRKVRVIQEKAPAPQRGGSGTV